MEDGARGERDLEVAFGTLQQTPGTDSGGSVMLTFRTVKAIRPPHLFKRILTGPLGAEAFLELKQG